MADVTVEYSKEHRTIDGFPQVTLNLHTVYLLTKNMTDEELRQTIQEFNNTVENLEEKWNRVQNTTGELDKEIIQRNIWDRKQLAVAFEQELEYRQ